MTEHFEQWWKTVTASRAPEILLSTAYDVAKIAFASGMAIGGKYTANDRTHPDRIRFFNGRIVKIESNKGPGVQHGVYLSVTGEKS